jgi:hypothetical protein
MPAPRETHTHQVARTAIRASKQGNRSKDCKSDFLSPDNQLANGRRYGGETLGCWHGNLFI